MDSMMLGETVDLDYQEYLDGFWMPSGGNSGVASVHVFFASEGITIQVQTKSSEQDDSDATALANLDIAGGVTGIYEFQFANAKDLVRYRVGGKSTEDLNSSAHLQLMAPSWAPN